MAQVRPSFMLILDIDERLDSAETRLEIARCYAHVSSTVVRNHAATDGEPENIARLIVRLGTRHYLRSTDEGADQLWSETIEHWLGSVFHKVGNNMMIYNRRQRELGSDEMKFSWLEVDLENGTFAVRLHLDSNCEVDPACVQFVTAARTALNKGLLGNGAVRVILPAPQSYAEQELRGQEEKRRREAEHEAQAEAARAEKAKQQVEAEDAAEQAFLESPKLTEQLANDIDEEHGDESAFKAAEFDPSRFDKPEPDFVINYDIWLVEYIDGTTQTYDCTSEEFVAIATEEKGA